MAGALGWRAQDLEGVSMREIWPMHAGRMQSIRQHVLWQSQIILREKLDVEKFLRTGMVEDPVARQVRISGDTGEKVAYMQGCWNRGLPEPDFTKDNWQEETEAAFKAHDEAVQPCATGT